MSSGMGQDYIASGLFPFKIAKNVASVLIKGVGSIKNFSSKKAMRLTYEKRELRMSFLETRDKLKNLGENEYLDQYGREVNKSRMNQSKEKSQNEYKSKEQVEKEIKYEKEKKANKDNARSADDRKRNLEKEIADLRSRLAKAEEKVAELRAESEFNKNQTPTEEEKTYSTKDKEFSNDEKEHTR